MEIKSEIQDILSAVSGLLPPDVQYSYGTEDIDAIIRDSQVLVEYIRELHEQLHTLLSQKEELVQQNLNLMELSANYNGNNTVGEQTVQDDDSLYIETY